MSNLESTCDGLAGLLPFAMVLRARTAAAALGLIAHLDALGVLEDASEAVAIVDFKLVLGNVASGNEASRALVAHAGENAVAGSE